MATNSLAAVNDFFSSRRIALVGLSRSPQDFSRSVFNELIKRGYDIVPVNPNVAEIESRRCFDRVSAITPPVEAALVMTPAAASESVVRDCAAAGVSRIWLHRGGGQGAVSDAAVLFCKDHSMNLVAGECPFMFLENTAWFHGAHRLVRKLTGAFPHN